MQSFFLVLAAILILIFVNPLSDDFNDSNWDSKTVIDLNVDNVNDSLDSDFSPNSIVITGLRCDLDVFIDDNQDHQFQKRFKKNHVRTQ